MKKQILFFHSAGPQGPHEGSNDLVMWLREALGSEYDVLFPIIPDPDDPTYATWKPEIQKQLGALEDDAILVGHSFGASVLLKYLSEETYNKSIAGMFLVATPFWSTEWEFGLQEGFASKLPDIPNIIFYHSRDDDEIPFDHLAKYAKHLPQATIRELDGYGHVYTKGLPELVEDITSL